MMSQFRRKTLIMLSLCFVTGVFSIVQSKESDEQNIPEILPHQLRIIPILEYDAGRRVGFQFRLTNTSNRTIKYLGTKSDAFEWTFAVRVQGKPVRPLEQDYDTRPVVHEEFVMALPPGGQIHEVFDVEQRYGKLSAGRYEIRAYFKRPFARLGLTPIDFERTILFFDVR